MARSIFSAKLSGQLSLFSTVLPILAGGFAEEPSERCLPGSAVERVSGLLELLPIQQALNVAGDRIRRHDEGCVERVDVKRRAIGALTHF